MAELDFGNSESEAMIVMQGFCQRVNSDLYNHGRDGLITRFNSFAATYVATEEERNKQHAANRFRLNIIIAILAMIAAYIAIILGMHGISHVVADNTPFHATLPSDYIAHR